MGDQNIQHPLPLLIMCLILLSPFNTLARTVETVNFTYNSYSKSYCTLLYTIQKGASLVRSSPLFTTWLAILVHTSASVPRKSYRRDSQSQNGVAIKLESKLLHSSANVSHMLETLNLPIIFVMPCTSCTGVQVHNSNILIWR